MPKRVSIILASLGLAASGALAQEADPAAGKAAEPSAELKARVEACSAHQFETMVVLPGRDRGSKVRICGDDGQTDAQWIATLKDSVAKTEANGEMDPEVKAQIVEALRIEIAKLEEAAKALHAPSIAEIAVNEGPVAAREPDPEYSSLPPLPAPKAQAKVSLARRPLGSAGGASPPRPAVVAPRLTIGCALPGESFAECTELETQTRLAVVAKETLAAGTSLRFRRGDKVRAELDLGGLQKGQSLRRKLPGSVCMGVMRGRVSIDIVSKGQVADSLGPYKLTCGT